MTGEGSLSYFQAGMQPINTPTWEHAGKLISARQYTGCSKTVMVDRGFPAIFLPDEQTGRHGIFIHQGTSQSHSEGCICIHPSEMTRLLEMLPSGVGDISVIVNDPL